MVKRVTNEGHKKMTKQITIRDAEHSSPVTKVPHRHRRRRQQQGEHFSRILDTVMAIQDTTRVVCTEEKRFGVLGRDG